MNKWQKLILLKDLRAYIPCNILWLCPWLCVGMQSTFWRARFRREPFSKCLASGSTSSCNHWSVKRVEKKISAGIFYLRMLNDLIDPHRRVPLNQERSSYSWRITIQPTEAREEELNITLCSVRALIRQHLHLLIWVTRWCFTPECWKHRQYQTWPVVGTISQTLRGVTSCIILTFCLL